MAAGPGKYDHLCTQAREAAAASAAVLLICNGNRGHGFAVQMLAGCDKSEVVDLTLTIASALRQIADQMQADARRLRQRIAAGEDLGEYTGKPFAPPDSSGGGLGE